MEPITGIRKRLIPVRGAIHSRSKDIAFVLTPKSVFQTSVSDSSVVMFRIDSKVAGAAKRAVERRWASVSGCWPVDPGTETGRFTIPF